MCCHTNLVDTRVITELEEFCKDYLYLAARTPLKYKEKSIKQKANTILNKRYATLPLVSLPSNLLKNFLISISRRFDFRIKILLNRNPKKNIAIITISITNASI